jgi:DNA-binding NarL/FixJ family response regulator
VRAVVAEDLALLRDGLTRMLEAHGIDVVAARGDVDGLVGVLEDTGAEVAILDVRLPPTFTNEGLRAAIEVRTARPAFPVLVLSQYVEHLYARELLGSGVGGVGYLLKDRVADVRMFVDAVGQVAAGGTVLDPEVVAAMLSHHRRRPAIDRLTPREHEVLALMAEGRSNGAIATALVVSEKAVNKHIGSIFTKLDLPSAPDDNRRVLAVLQFLEAAGSPDR